MNRSNISATLLALCLGTWGCASKESVEASKSTVAKNESQAFGDVARAASIEEEVMEDSVASPTAPMPASSPVIEERKDKVGRSAPKKKRSGVLGGAGGKGGGPGASGAEQGPAPRAWFPETFLFNPLVVTDESGNASVSVKVPDRLTSWRILGLAHSRSGSQAGAVASFEGTLPAYVDPVVPSFLRVGDTVRIPVQLVNNTDAAMQTQLKVEVEGGTLVSRPQAVSIPKRSSAVRFVEVNATQAGTLRLMARMGDADMVVRTVDVVPTGRPVGQTKSGTLAAPRSVSLVGAEGEDATKGIADLSVYPGALALLRSEMSAAGHRGGVAEDAFSLLIAGKAPALLTALGDTPDTEALRKLSITAGQKVIKHARVLSIGNAALIAEAARSHPGNPVLERLATRAIATIESSQSPDGTCGGATGWTLQRLLVATADCARAASSSPNVTIRASGAFERNAKEISDPYTAAAILAAHGATGALADALRAKVLEGIEERDDGAKVLAVPAGVVRADGRRPSEVEATAMAVLALAEVADAPLADLGATILANYAPHWGWGDGRANLVCLEASVQLFSDPLPEIVKLTLEKDGVVIAEGELASKSVRDVVRLHADDLDVAGAHDWKVIAEPAVPGLGFSLRVGNWVPWTAEQALGSELSVEVEGEMHVGKAANLAVQAVAPSGQSFVVELALPAGVQVDTASLDALVAQGVLRKFAVADGQVSLTAAPLQPAKRFSASVRVIPTLAGELQTGPTKIVVGRESGHLPPMTFVVAP